MHSSNMIAVTIWMIVTLFACTVSGQKKPPNYQQNEMPETSFSCKDKIVGGYYADAETSCQMFHVCVNVVGTGVQDFRFLCPNDTAFDQENQICDDWYNIDCDAATLYYSDNFDLYRLGSGGVPVTSGKVTPIPLGPSSAPPAKVQPPKSRKPSLSTPVNNAVSENDDDYYLQRSDSSDSKLQHDLLRGSSSGNFFSNRNRGVENPDDYDDTVRVASSKDVPKKNTKAPFRKLLTGKKPVAESSSVTTTTTVASVPITAETQQRSAATTVRQPNYKPTTYRSKDRGRVNYKTYLDKQAKADEYDYQKVTKPSAQTTTFAAVTTAYQPTTTQTNIAYQTTQINNAQTFTQVNSNQPTNNDFLRITPINNNKNNGFQSNRINSVPANNNGFQSNRINSVSANNNNNFQVNTPFPVNNNNNHFQANNAYPANNNNYQANNAFPANNNNNFKTNNVFPANNNNVQGSNVFQPVNNNFQQNVNLNQGGNFQSEKLYTTTQNYNPSPAANTFPNNAFQQQQVSNTFQPKNQFQSGQTTQVYSTYQSPTTFQQSTNVFQSSTPFVGVAGGNFFQQQQQTSQQPQFQSTTEHFSKDFKAKFDPYSSYLHQRTNEEADELLKTAPSTNLRPSDLNALVQQGRPKSINATLSVGYNFNKADGGVAKSTVVVPAPTTQKPRPFTTQPATIVTASGSSSSSTTAYVTAAAVASNSTKKAIASKDKDSSYDYAYYDDSNQNDYTDVVPEDFSRLHSAKKF